VSPLGLPCYLLDAKCRKAIYPHTSDDGQEPEMVRPEEVKDGVANIGNNIKGGWRYAF